MEVLEYSPMVSMDKLWVQNRWGGKVAGMRPVNGYWCPSRPVKGCWWPSRQESRGRRRWWNIVSNIKSSCTRLTKSVNGSRRSVIGTACRLPSRNSYLLLVRIMNLDRWAPYPFIGSRSLIYSLY